jgi:lysozyme
MNALFSFKKMMILLLAGAVLLASLGFTSAVSAQSTCGDSYTVQKGDYLTKIARTCGVTYADLLKANPTITTPSKIYPGQVIKIPGVSIPVTGSVPAVYTVKQGDTLFSISQAYKLTVADLRAANTTVGTTITTGQVLNIPARIAFAAGGTSATQTGTVPANLSHYFILRASKDQTLNVTVTPQDKLQLTVYGADGTVLKSSTSEGAAYSGVLPATQDYVVAVKSGTQAQAFTLTVSIPAVLPIPVTGTTTYTVKTGDTLFSIAKGAGTTVAVLMRANPEITDKNNISVGQVIYLPGATIKLSDGKTVYIVNRGESLGAIAKKFNITLSALTAANTQITNINLIFTGQRINIP